MSLKLIVKWWTVYIYFYKAFQNYMQRRPATSHFNFFLRLELAVIANCIQSTLK